MIGLVMAGGKGARLKPFTNVLPKPLLPINGKTILEHIVHQFEKFGLVCSIFYVFCVALRLARFNTLSHDEKDNFFIQFKFFIIRVFS